MKLIGLPGVKYVAKVPRIVGWTVAAPNVIVELVNESAPKAEKDPVIGTA